MEPRQVLEKAFRAGHGWAVDPSMTLADVKKLDIGEPTAKAMLRSYRSFDANFDTLLQAAHGPGRGLMDDSFGPATSALAELKRCPMPDVPPPANAAFDGFGEMETQLLQNLQQFATGSGSWPAEGCNPKHKGIHSIRINLDTSGAADHWKRDLPYVTEMVHKMYAEVGLHIEYVFDGEPLEAEIEKRFQRIPGGVIGWNYFPNVSLGCRQTIPGRLDNDYQADRYMKAVLEAHETGHGVTLQHTRGGLMNPTILRLASLSFKGDTHERTVRNLFGGKPINVTPGDPDTPAPPSPLAPQLRDIYVDSGGKTYRYKVTLVGSDSPGGDVIPIEL